MTALHSPAIRLLRLVCPLEPDPAREDELAELVAQQPDWELVYRLGDRHRLLPFLYRTLRRQAQTPPVFLEKLRLECRAIATDSLVKIRDYQSITQVLAGAGIAHRPMKGMLWATTRYPDTSLRPIGDLDLLIAPDNVPECVKLLAAHGYKPGLTHRLYLARSTAAMLNDLWEISLFKHLDNQSRFDIDLHWGVECFNRDYTLFGLAELVETADYETEIQLLLLTVHHGVNNIWQHISYLNDLYFLLHNTPVNWVWLLDKLRHYGLENVFLAGLHLCRQQHELALPLALAELLARPAMLRLAAGYVAHWEADQAKTHSYMVLARLWFLLKAQPNRRGQLRVWQTFISSRVQRISLFKVGNRLIYIPRTYGFLTIFARVIRSAWGLVRLRLSGLEAASRATGRGK